MIGEMRAGREGGDIYITGNGFFSSRSRSSSRSSSRSRSRSRSRSNGSGSGSILFFILIVVIVTFGYFEIFLEARTFKLDQTIFSSHDAGMEFMFNGVAREVQSSLLHPLARRERVC